MTLEIGIVLIIVFSMLICLITEVSRPDFVVFLALSFLILSGVLSPSDALRGFSNEGMLTVALLFIIAGSVQQSGLLNQMINRAMGSGLKPQRSLLRMMIPISSLSAFLNNTPIVVMFTPIVKKWCKEHGLSPSKFLMPLSFAAIFGGTITLIGTSTNLLVHGLMLEHGLSGFSMFTLALVSVPAGIIGILFMTSIGYKLLPSRKTSEESFSDDSKEYLGEVIVEANSPLVAKTITEAGFNDLSDLYLIEIIRNNGERIAPVSPYKKIRANDRLIFSGVISTIVELQNIKGLRVETGSNLKLEDLQNGNASLVEAVVSHQSSLIHQSIKQSNFRSKFGAGVVAVHRNHERIKSKVGDIVFKPGDTLLLLANKDFLNRWSNSNDFYLTSPIAQPQVVSTNKSIIAIFTLVSMVLLASFNVLSMFKATMLAVIFLFLTKTVTFEGIKRLIQFNVLLLIACSIGIGIAIDQTGTAALLANYFILMTKGIGIIGAVIVVYLLTTLFTEVITNNAAVVLMFPISLSIATQLGVDPMAFFVTIAIAASASFATPIGYQTNLIVYGPGGYRFSDYLKVGIPLNLLYLIVTITVVYFNWL